jgi:glycosyltransferase involved in cell wall biosynthesis
VARAFSIGPDGADRAFGTHGGGGLTMRIAYLSSSRLPSPFANSVHVMKMCRALASLGHEVTLHGKAGDGDPFASYGVPPIFTLSLTHPPSGRVIQALAHARAVRQALQRATPDLLYARNVWSLLAASTLDRPFVFEAHTLPASRAQQVAERYLFEHRHFLRLVVISDVLRSDYLAAFPMLAPAKVVVAHDGADPAILPSPPVAWPGRAATLQVGYIGHLYPGKGMEVVAALAPRCPQFDFHVVGGTPEDLARWRAAAAHANLHYHGFLPHHRLASCYAALDVVLVPLQSKVALQNGKGEIGRWTSPLKLFEAMATGKALVVSRHPTLQEVVTDGCEALVADPQRVDEWITCLQRLETDQGLRERLGTAAQRSLLDGYTWDARARRVLAGLTA